MKINKKDSVACNYFEACDYFKNMKRLQEENKKLKEVTNEAKIEYENLLINRNDFAERAEKLEQENKELRQVRKNSPDIQEPYIYLYRQIKKQCHKLKQENEELKEKEYKTALLSEELTKYKQVVCKEYDEIERLINKTTNERNKYKQALEEIREIAKHWLNNDWSCYHCRSNMDEKLKEIIKLTRF